MASMACHWAISRDVNELTIVYFKLGENKGHFDAEWCKVSLSLFTLQQRH